MMMCVVSMLDKPSKVGKRGEEAVEKEDKDRQRWCVGKMTLCLIDFTCRPG